MISWTDAVFYPVVVGFQFVALCKITRVGRGWPLQFVGLAVLVGLNVLTAWWDLAIAVPTPLWLLVNFATGWLAFVALVCGLSRESPGRKLFLATSYGVYSVGLLSILHVLVYRNVFHLPVGWIWAIGVAVVTVANLGFVCWILPLVPGDSRKHSWMFPNVAVFMLYVLLCVGGVWPISVVESPPLECLPFLVALVLVLMVYPEILRSLRNRLYNAEIEHNLALLMTEMQERRRVIDQVRRMRHDQRHHSIQIAEYLLRGKCDRALAYLRELDGEANETPTERLVWCENETVNAILSGCARQAKARGVELSAELRIGRIIPLSDIEIVAVVANLVENAIHAASALGSSGSPRPQVRVMLCHHPHGVGITISNPVPEDFALSPKGTPCEEPGIGMESIRRVVERRKGVWTYGLIDGILTCQVVLMVDGESGRGGGMRIAVVDDDVDVLAQTATTGDSPGILVVSDAGTASLPSTNCGSVSFSSALWRGGGGRSEML